MVTGAVLTGAKVKGAVVTGAKVMGAAVMGDRMPGVVVKRATVVGFVVTGAVVTGANVTGAAVMGDKVDVADGEIVVIESGINGAVVVGDIVFSRSMAGVAAVGMSINGDTVPTTGPAGAVGMGVNVGLFDGASVCDFTGKIVGVSVMPESGRSGALVVDGCTVGMSVKGDIAGRDEGIIAGVAAGTRRSIGEGDRVVLQDVDPNLIESM
jgi:hypothetical protein